MRVDSFMPILGLLSQRAVHSTRISSADNTRSFRLSMAGGLMPTMGDWSKMARWIAKLNIFLTSAKVRLPAIGAPR